MADPLQIENMDAQQIAERHVIERYLAGQLTDQEAMAFEAYVEAHPEITRDIEEIARMKTGLVRLKDRGDLPSVVVPRGNWISRRTGLVAAGVAVVAIGLLMFAPALNHRQDRTLMAATIESLAGDERPPVMISSIVLSRSRSLTPETLHASPQESFVQVSIELFAEDDLQAYSVQLLQMIGGTLEPRAELADLRVNAEGNLVVYLREDSLRAGDYVLRVAGSAAEEPADFALRISR